MKMTEVKRMADSVDPSLKVTTDCKGNHADGRLPVLDLKVWIGKDENGNNKVLYSHYMKEVASRATIHWRSSHSNELKRNVMINEILRIFRNCSEDIPWNETSEHVSHYMKRMQFSGYPESVRRDMQRHANSHHNGGHFEVEVEILAQCYGRPTKRLITEAVLIDEIPSDKAMNNKSEWSYVKLAKVQVPGT